MISRCKTAPMAPVICHPKCRSGIRVRKDINTIVVFGGGVAYEGFISFKGAISQMLTIR